MFPIGSRYSNVGIWQPVSIFTRSDVYVDDVFVKTSVRRGTIEVDYTLRNLTSEPKTVAVAATSSRLLSTSEPSRLIGANRPPPFSVGARQA